MSNHQVDPTTSDVSREPPDIQFDDATDPESLSRRKVIALDQVAHLLLLILALTTAAFVWKIRWFACASADVDADV
jgi:hypothetical protein